VQLLFSNAISEAVSKHIPLSAIRLETLAWLTLLIMRQGTICLWRLAAHVAIVARTESVRRRFYRFFQHVELDGAMTARGTTPAKNNAVKIRVASNARMTSTRLASTFGRGAFSRAAPANSARCKRFDLDRSRRNRGG
jgi:hypothetical protein